MTIEQFQQELLALESEEDKTTFTQRHYLHGIPTVFHEREHDYYSFRKRIGDNFQINFSEVLIVGSSKFGFSPFRFTEFSLNSDIDVVLINEGLFNSYFDLISNYQYLIRNQTIRLNDKQFKEYMKFIRYFVMGWMRPDLLPQNTTEFKELKQQWDDFFLSISYEKSEVGNYKVKAGLFKNQNYAEKYYKSSIDSVKIKLKSF